MSDQTFEERKAVLVKRRADQALEGVIAMREYEKSILDMRTKTERLRALRLAKEAADAITPTPQQPMTLKASKRAPDKVKKTKDTLNKRSAARKVGDTARFVQTPNGPGGLASDDAPKGT